jgi:hypothetical protein
MPTVNLSALAGAGQQFFDNNGVPLSGGKLYSYAAGTTTPQTTYTSVSGATAHTNPIVLDSAGRVATGEIWLTAGQNYKFVLKTSTETTLATWDNITGIGGTGVATNAEFVTYDPPFTNAVATNVEAKLAQTVSVKDFGAVGNGVTDDTVAIQAAIDSGAKKIIGIAGNTYKITNTLNILSSSINLDFQNSTLFLNDATGLKSHIAVGNGVTQLNGTRLNNIIFTRSQVATGGYAVDLNFVGVTDVTGCRVFGDSKIFGGIKVIRGVIINIEDNYIQNCVSIGIYLEGTGTGANRTVDVSIRENRVEGGVFGLSTWDFVEGLFCRDNIFFNQSSTCAAINASTNANGLYSFKLQENDFDTAPNGLFVQNVNNVQITDNWFSNNSAKCLAIGLDVAGGVVADNQMYPAVLGIEMYGSYFTVTGNYIAGPGTGCFFKSTASNITFNNNLLQTDYGADVTENPASILIGCNSFVNLLGTITGTGGTGTIIEGNLGDPNRGNATNILVGASPFTYTSESRPSNISIIGGTVSGITVDGEPVSGASTTTVNITLPPRTSMVVTYSSIPTMTSLFL